MKKTSQLNFRVQVSPRSIGAVEVIRLSDFLAEPDETRRTEYYKDACQTMISQIKRHVDGVQGVSMIFDTESVCSFCGNHWTEKSETYNGGCCDKDEANNPEIVAAQS